MSDILFPVIKNSKTGFINNNGQVVIDFVFDGASTFSEGLARIFVGDKTGFIDINGNVKIAPIFERALGFSEGKAVITINDKHGFIDINGNIIIEPKFYRASNFENGIALAMEDIISTGCFIDTFGTIKLKGRNYLVSKYNEGLINCSDNNGWGYIDVNDDFVIPATYKYARPFFEGRAAVSPQKDNKGKPNRKELYGFINKNNEMIIPPLFKGADIQFSEGLCAIWDNGYGYINESGQIAIPCDLDLGQHFSEGLAVFKPKGKNKKYGFIDKEGKIAIDPIYTHAESFDNGLSAVIIGEKYENYLYGYINKTGKYIWNPSR